MNKLREVINLKAAVFGAVFFTVLSGIVTESAEAHRERSRSGNIICGIYTPRGHWIVLGGSVRSSGCSGLQHVHHPDGTIEFIPSSRTSPGNDGDFDSVSNQEFRTNNEEFFASSESFLLSDDISLQSQSIDEPSNKLGLIALGAFGLKLALKRKRKYSND